MEHYHKLAALDYKVRIRLCTEEDYPSRDRKSRIPYFYATTSPELDVERQVLVRYEIIFTPVYLRSNPELCLWKEDMEAFVRKNHLTYSDLIMKRYAYYPAFVGIYDPTSIEIGSCLSDDDDESDEIDYENYCNGKVRVYETGLWCDMCHDNFTDDIDRNLSYLIEKVVCMSNFPLQSILEIRKKTEPLPEDFNPKKYMRRLAKKASKLEKIKQELQTWDEETQRLLHEREKKKQVLLSCLN